MERLVVSFIYNSCYHVYMESIGKYWIPIFNCFENDIEVCLTYPKYFKVIKELFVFII